MGTQIIGWELRLYDGRLDYRMVAQIIGLGSDYRIVGHIVGL